MLLKSVLATAVLALFGFTLAENADNAATNGLEHTNKGIEAAGRCGSHHHHHGKPRCCGCPRKGSMFKVKTLTNHFLDLLIAKNPAAANLIDQVEFLSYVQGFLDDPYACCAWYFNVQNFFYWWFNQLPASAIYPIFAEGEHATWEQHGNGCIVVPFDLVFVEPSVSKLPSTVTRAVKAKITWCPSEGCNWKINYIDFRSYACLNVTPVLCPYF